MSRNLTLNEITVTTIADNVDADSEMLASPIQITYYCLLSSVLLASSSQTLKTD